MEKASLPLQRTCLVGFPPGWPQYSAIAITREEHGAEPLVCCVCATQGEAPVSALQCLWGPGYLGHQNTESVVITGAKHKLLYTSVSRASVLSHCWVWPGPSLTTRTLAGKGLGAVLKDLVHSTALRLSLLWKEEEARISPDSRPWCHILAGTLGLMERSELREDRHSPWTDKEGP